jgi:hypothetical protein
LPATRTQRLRSRSESAHAGRNSRGHAEIPEQETNQGIPQLRLSKSEFGIFDAFEDDAGRKAHLNGPIAAALMSKASELLAEPPKIEQVDLLAAKLPK